MNKQAMLQDSSTSKFIANSVCSFDFEAIDKPTKALMHQQARFLFFKNGKGTFVIDGEEYQIFPNTLISITPWRITDITEVQVPLQLIKVIYNFQYINSILKAAIGLEDESTELIHTLSESPVAYLNEEQAQYIETLLDQIKDEMGVESTLISPEKKSVNFLYSIGKIIELMIMHRRCLDGQVIKQEDSKIPNEHLIMNYIFSHSSEKLTLEKVAEVFFISESTLSKLIAETTGTTFVKLLNNMRVEKASDYLIYTDMNLEEIAKLLGFVDASHISKHFTAKIGITPMEYRKIYTHGDKEKERNLANKNIAFAVTDFLYKNYDAEKLTASMMAKKYGISISELNRSLLYYSEKNFDNLLNFIRINKACELLLSSNDSVLNIAIAVGYSNIKTFNLNFYKFKEMNPTQFRKSITLDSYGKGKLD